MQYVLERTNRKSKKVAGVGGCTPLKKSLQWDSGRFNAKDQEANGTIPKNSDQGCIFLTLVSLECDSSRRLSPPFVLPLVRSNHRKHLGSGSEQKMNSLVVYPPPTLLFIDLQGPQGSHLLDPQCSAKPFPSTHFSQPNILGQSRNRNLTKETRISAGSCKQVSSGSSHLAGSRNASSNDRVKETSGPVKRSGKRKNKKKGKQYKKPACNIELETVNEDKNDDLIVLDPTANVSLITLPQNQTTEDFTITTVSNYDVENKVAEIDGDFFGSRTKKTGSCDEISFDIFSDDYSPPVADSFSDSWNSDSSVHGETRSVTIEEENFGIGAPDTGMVSDCSNHSTSSLSLTSGIDASNNLPNKFCISNNNWSKCVDGANTSNNHRTSGDTRSIALTKKGGRGKKSTGSSTGLLHRYGDGANIHRRTGKENNHSVWQKVQKHEGDEAICGPKKTDYSQTDAQNKVSYTTDSDIFLAKEDDRSIIRVSEWSRGKPNSGSNFESNIHPGKGLNTNKTNSIKPAKTSTCQKEPPETDVTHTEFAKQDSSELISQKWIPVGKKDFGLSNPSRTNNFLPDFPDESVVDSRTSKKVEENELISNGHGLVSQTDGEIALCPSFGNANFPSPDDSAPICSLGNGDSPSNLDRKAKLNGVPVYGCDSNKIIEAVRDSYRFQLTSEAVQLATGSPIAEFERLLRSASPVLVPTSGVQTCKSCPADQLIGNSLCRHRIPNISLGRIWEWYEKPGSYGLEVKGEDYHNSKRDFHAYFVPYLSAVQLFRRSRSLTPASSDMADEELIEVWEGDKSQNAPDIFSILLPKPQKAEGISISRSVNTMSTADTCGSLQDDDSELLFEYFESEQPQQRRPLFEKIKELVRGNGCSGCQLYGDPSNLDCLYLHDLHPSSWYSVAWYPIYRIPDGNFRSAFLTYHSLGIFNNQSASSVSLGGNAGVVSPVVGLQSYNTQGECWFLQKIQPEENSPFNPSGILKERLRTLEQTACTMARASICKGDLKSANKQPDFEFFLSRKRWM